MKIGLSICISLITLHLLVIPAQAIPTMAFGYLSNKSNDINYEYLETIFPNSFANSIRNVFQVNVLKPHQINQLLEKHNQKLEKNYKPYLLPDLTDRLSVDYFIYGDFLLLPNERIRINLHLYSNKLKKIFSFTNVGKMETEIFRLVDRITRIMIDFMGSSNFYMSQKIPRGSKIGIITNLTGKELNYLYYLFLTEKYNIASIQGNALESILTDDSIEKFRNISSVQNSFDTITDRRTFRFLYGTWSDKKYFTKINKIEQFYLKHDLEYLSEKFDALTKLRDYHKIDYLLIIGFNGAKSNAWVRCIDANSRDLIWIQSNIQGNLRHICETMIQTMNESNAE